MPYERKSGRFERARSTGHVPIAKNEMVQERLKSYRVFDREEEIVIHPSLITAADTLGSPGELVKWILSFDGSPQEVAVREEYPSTRIGFIQIAGVLVHLEELLSQQSAHLVDPTVIHAAVEEALHSMVLPGSNVCRDDMNSVWDSWRAEVYDIFGHYKIEDIPLLEIFMLLVQHSDKNVNGQGVAVAKCSASEECDERNIVVPPGGTKCPKCNSPVFPTDAFRVHEEVNEEHGNATALGRFMSVLEHITMAAYLHFLMERQPRVLGSVALILDGPLALFGPQAWFHGAMLKFIHHIRQNLSENKLRWPLVIGIEKGGQFAEHAEAINTRIPRRSIMALPDDYIFKHILTYRLSPSSTFGRDTYYGQKFFYKTARGQLLTITVPKCPSGVPDPHNPVHYPDLPDALSLLDRIGTNLYKDAVIPVALAHSYASIPLRTGSKVLALLSKKFLANS